MQGGVFIRRAFLDAGGILLHLDTPAGVFIGGAFSPGLRDGGDGAGLPGDPGGDDFSLYGRGVVVSKDAALEFLFLTRYQVHQGDLFHGGAEVIEALVGVDGMHDLFIIPVRPGGSLHDDAPLGVILVAGVAAARQGLDGDAELVVIGIGGGACQHGAVAFRTAQDKPAAVRVLFHDAFTEGGVRSPEFLDGLDLLPLFAGKHVAFIGGDDALVSRTFGDDGLVPLHAALPGKDLEARFLACNDHRPFDGVPLVGINLDGISLRDGFSASIPGNLGDSVLGDGEVVGGTAETQHAVPGTGDAVNVPLAVFGNLDLGIVGLFRDNGSGLGGHGMDAAGREVQRLGRAVRLDNFSE